MSDSSRQQFESCIEYRIYNPEKLVQELGQTFCLILREVAKIKQEDTQVSSLKNSLLQGKLVTLTKVLEELKSNLAEKPEATPTEEKTEVPLGWDKIENAKQE